MRTRIKKLVGIIALSGCLYTTVSCLPTHNQLNSTLSGGRRETLIFRPAGYSISTTHGAGASAGSQANSMKDGEEIIVGRSADAAWVRRFKSG